MKSNQQKKGSKVSELEFTFERYNIVQKFEEM
jgi:hypothetical protein